MPPFASIASILHITARKANNVIKTPYAQIDSVCQIGETAVFKSHPSLRYTQTTLCMEEEFCPLAVNEDVKDMYN